MRHGARGFEVAGRSEETASSTLRVDGEPTAASSAPWRVVARCARLLLPALALFLGAAVAIAAKSEASSSAAKLRTPDEGALDDGSLAQEKDDGEDASDGEKKDGDKKADEDAKDKPRWDEVTLLDGSKYVGRLVDLTKSKVIIDTYRGKRFLMRAMVKDIARTAPKKALGVYKKFAKKAGDQKAKPAAQIKSWKTLRNWCKKQKLQPEYRRCVRELFRLEPKKKAEHLPELGEAKYKNKWRKEEWVEERRAKGWAVKNGELIEKKRTEVDEDSGKEEKKKSKKELREERKILDEDHLTQAIAGDPKSLWLLLARSGHLMVELDKGWARVSYNTCKQFIEELRNLGGFERRMKLFLESHNLPTDWEAVNRRKVERFLDKFSRGLHKETKYYHILTTCDEKIAAELAMKMDAITRDIYSSIFKFEEKITSKYVVRFYSSEAEYHKQGGPRGSGAFYSPSSKELVGFKKPKRYLRGGTDPFSSMFHEGWHQYFDFYIPSSPRWFDEGFAEVISPVKFKGRRAVMSQYNPGRHEYLRYMMQRDRLVPLDELIRMSHREFYQPGVIGIAYAQAWSFMYFLVNYKSSNAKVQKAVRNFYVDYFWELRAGTDPVEAVDKVFKEVRFGTLERAWLKAIPRQNAKRAQ